MRHLFYISIIFTLLAATCAGAQVERSRTTNPLIYGINIVWGVDGGDKDWKRDDMHLKLAKHAREIGVTNTRVGICWFSIEEQQGRYDWSEIDERINFLHEQGLEIVGCVATVPLWATGLRGDDLKLVEEKYPDFIGVLPCADEHLGAMAKWCEEFARRYKGKVKYYEIGNEDDGWPAPIIVRDYNGKPLDVRIGGDSALYTKRLKTCYQAIKKIDPDAQVSVTGLSGGGHTMFLQQIYGNGGGDFFDAVSIHPYVNRMEEGADWHWLEMTRDLLAIMGDSHKKLWLTEWGYGVDNDDPASLALHAEMVEQSLLRMQQLDYVEIASLHTLNDWRPNESDPSSVQKMGLLTYDLQKKPAYEGYARAAHGKGVLRETVDMPARPMPKRPGGEVLNARFAPTAPAIDAGLGDWKDAAPSPLLDSEGGEKGSVRIMWDVAAVYLAVEVADSHHFQPYGGEWMWRGDSVQVAFDPERQARWWPRYAHDDVEFGFCLTPLGVQGLRFHGGVNLPTGVVLPLKGEKSVAKKALRAAIRTQDGVYRYEIAIPWDEITNRPIRAGEKIGISVAVNSFGEEKKRSVYQFGSGIAGDKDPSLFKTILLTGE